MKSKNMFWGFLFILVGISVLLNQFLILPILSFRIILSIVLIIYAIHSIFNRSWWSVTFPLLYVVWMNRYVLGLDGYVQFFPLLLAGIFISIGLSTLFPKYKNKYYYKSMHTSHDNKKQQNEDVVYCNTSFTSNVHYLNSKNLETVHARCYCGDLDIYMNQAVIASVGLHVYIDCKMGALTLYVPKDYRIDSSDISYSLSGFDVPYYNAMDTNYPIIYLHGSFSLANVRIIYI